jgi:pimeloyl-ACP methyl ester carboxylesterase
MSSRLAVVLSMCVVLSIPAFPQQPHAGQVSFEPYTLATYDGQSHSAELGHLWVPENRQRNSSRLIRLAFVRLKSSAANPGSPIVYLAGGPGIPGIVMARVPVYYNLFEKLRQTADVILLDQRGLGMSSPNLNDCSAGGKLPTDAFATRERFVHALAQAAGDCTSYWRSKGVDLTAYNTEENADDIDDLRRALGAAKISLLGHSYGTELGLSVIRRHGDRVARAVLASVEGPGDHDTMPWILDLQLKKIARLVAADPTVGKDFPDLFSLFEADIMKLQTHPATLTITKHATNKPIQVTVGAVALEFMVEQMLANGRAISALPALLKSISLDDDSLLQRRIESLYNDFDSGITLMGLTTDCAAPTPPARVAQTQSEARASLFADVSRIDMQPEICTEALGKFALGSEYFAPLSSDVPTLFLSGTLDADTPPMKAERMRWGFSQSTMIVVENGFHETLPAPEIQSLVADFLRGTDVKGRYITFDVPTFLSLDDAKKSTQKRR